MTGTLILVRHGESEWNKNNLFCGWVDVRLSPKGETQARNTAKLIKQFQLKPQICFTSKLTRANQTTNIILDELNELYLDVHKTWRLNERHYGALQGRDKSEVLKEFGEQQYMFMRRAYDGCPPLATPDNDFYSSGDERYTLEREQEPQHQELPKGESLHMTMNRLIPYFENVIEPHLQNGKTVLCVTHGSIVRAMLKYLFDIGDEEISMINVPNGIPLKC
ncbi:unnamed protein product [Ambrosiozyma monospora]|uniref:Phosphoglycerate mutase n=1 Tax=Ambrosiozyma monospora TaxID=43982 RepID=A0A9W6YXF3_AMBMO|nr:unnamed protein product [Ambrosiozyma monospora]